MANKKINMNALKRERQDKAKKKHNTSRMKAMKTFLKKARSLGTAEAFVEAQSYIAKNVNRNLVHKNKAARLISKLSNSIKS